MSARGGTKRDLWKEITDLQAQVLLRISERDALKARLAEAERLGDALAENLSMIREPEDYDSLDALTAWREAAGKP